MEDYEEARVFRGVIRKVFELSAASNPGDFLPPKRWIDFQGVEKRMIRLQEKGDRLFQGLIDERRIEKEGKVKTMMMPCWLCKMQNLKTTLTILSKATTRFAIPAPGHCLLPIPNGTNLYAPFSPPSNLSGLKVVGSSHTVGSLCMAHALTSSIVPRGTSNPPTVELADDSCGTRRGIAGNNRSSVSCKASMASIIVLIRAKDEIDLTFPDSVGGYRGMANDSLSDSFLVIVVELRKDSFPKDSFLGAFA
ncbi:hypothetical protein RJ639_003941 [Escallonia herrerae]|uniref:Uncharacterized protein n=1 Tax=Escallonia herrerae TaxID=1293975 RepID=A0AA88W2Q7_9ASTE|nr:hypothetical protein RJ639_003941 [Escallonia herrerae]